MNINIDRLFIVFYYHSGGSRCPERWGKLSFCVIRFRYIISILISILLLVTIGNNSNKTKTNNKTKKQTKNTPPTQRQNKTKQNEQKRKKTKQHKTKQNRPTKQTNKQIMRMITSPIIWKLILIVYLLYFIIIQEAQKAPKVEVSCPFLLFP